MGIIGNPNVNLGKAANGGDIFIIFPNPTNDILSAIINFPQISNAKVWIVKGDYKTYPTNSEIDMGSNTMIVGGSPLIERDSIYGNDIYGAEVIIGMYNLPNGYYRVYCQNGNNLYWDNLIIDHQLKMN